MGLMRLDKLLPADERKRPLTAEEADALWDQYSDAFGVAQESYDSSIRTISAAGVAVTATMAAAFDAATRTVALAVVCFLTALVLNLLSYGSEQRDIGSRMRAVRRLDRGGAYGNGWVTTTVTLNVLAGVAILAGGICLAVFVFQSTPTRR